MTAARVLVVGEGPNELGPPLPHPAGGAWPLGQDHLPALPQLVHRLLDCPRAVSYAARQRESRKHVHRNLRGRVPPGLPGYGKQVLWAIRWAATAGYGAIVLVIDRDCTRHEDRIGAMRDGRQAAEETCPLPCALGCAVETFDAWMIADGKAVGAAGGEASRSHPAPESLDDKEGTGRHPKDRAIDLFGRRDALTDAYAKVAASADLELLARACPQGFAPFAAEVKERIAPVIGQA